MNKQQKKLLILLILLIIVVVIIVNIFSALSKAFFGEKPKEKGNSYSDTQLNVNIKEKGKYNVSVFNTEYAEMTEEEVSGLDSTIDFVLDCINNKKYSELYDKMTDVYLEIKFKTLKDFESYMGSTFPYTDYECESYKLSSYNCFAIIKSAQNGEEIHRVKIRNQDFSRIEETEIFFDNFNYISTVYGFTYAGDAMLTAKYFAHYADKSSIYVKIENKTNKAMKLDFYNTKLTKFVAGEELELITEKQSIVEVGANKTEYVEIFFEKPNATIYSPNSCYFDVLVNGKNYEAEMPLVYQEEEEL